MSGVLEVMDAACCVLAMDKTADPQKQLEEARATVAELIAAAEEVAEMEDEPRFIYGAIRSLRAAIAKATGADA